MNQDANGISLPEGPWHLNKVLWFVADEYRGGLLIRTFPAGHPGRTRLLRDELFSAAQYLPPPPSSRLPAARGAFDYPSSQAVSAPGCYAWQIDGDDFSYVIFFNAVIGAV